MNRLYIVLCFLVSSLSIFGTNLGTSIKVGSGNSESIDGHISLGLNYRKEIVQDIDFLGDLEITFLSDGYVPTSLFCGPSLNLYRGDLLSLDIGLLMGLSFLTDIKGSSSRIAVAGKIKNIFAFNVYRNFELQLLIDTVYYSFYYDNYMNIEIGLGFGFKL